MNERFPLAGMVDIQRTKTVTVVLSSPTTGIDTIYLNFTLELSSVLTLANPIYLAIFITFVILALVYIITFIIMCKYSDT